MQSTVLLPFRHRAPRPAVRARWASALACAIVLTSCTTTPQTDEGTRRPPATSALPAPSEHTAFSGPPLIRQPTSNQPRSRLPTAPAVGRASALAGQLDRAVATLRHRDRPESDVRRAGELQQLAVRALSTASPRFRRAVFRHLRPETAGLTTGMVRAVRPLRSITDPQRHLPRWRIVAPPPANELLGHYRAAQRRTGVPWTYLAAIHLVETRMGRIRGTSSAGARGPMQFLPSTWQVYGAGGDINDPEDAIHAAARLLADHGAPHDMAEALWHYNPSQAYVRAVSQHAKTMQRWSYAYRGYWHWRVLYRHVRGTYVLPTGYPRVRAVLVEPRDSD